MPLPWFRRPLPAALGAQALGALAVVALAWLVPEARAHPWWLAWGQGAAAAAFAFVLFEAPWWWLPIHLAFVPLALAARGLGLAPGWYLAAFALLLLTYGRTDRSRVPLYLTNRTTADALARLLPPTPAAFVDLGCGDAGLLRRLARARPDCRFVGIEHAPLPWAVGRLLALRLPNVDVRLGDFWRTELAQFDVVYAFLSPVPMEELWRKARREMRAGALLVSNSFAVPGVGPEREEILSDRRATRLLSYRPGGRRNCGARA